MITRRCHFNQTVSRFWLQRELRTPRVATQEVLCGNLSNSSDNVLMCGSIRPPPLRPAIYICASVYAAGRCVTEGGVLFTFHPIQHIQYSGGRSAPIFFLQQIKLYNHIKTLLYINIYI